jgi:hypothetical protein
MSLIISPNLGNPIVNTELEFIDSSSEYKTQPNLLATTTATPTLTVTQGNANIWVYTAGSSQNPIAGEDLGNDLNDGRFLYSNNSDSTQIYLTIDFPYFNGQTSQRTDWQQRYDNFVASDLVGKQIRLVNVGNFAQINFGTPFNTTFSKVIAVDTTGLYGMSTYAYDRAIRLTLESPLFGAQFLANNQGYYFNRSMVEFAEAGVYLEILSEIITIPTNVIDTAGIPSVHDIISINGYSQYTSELKFVANQIKMPKSVYASTTTEPQLPNPTVLATISSVTPAVELITYGNTDSTSSAYWFNNTAPTNFLGNDYFALYFSHIYDFYEPGVDRIMIDNNTSTPIIIAFLQAIYDNSGGKIAIKHAGNIGDPEFTHPLLTYQVMSPITTIQPYSGSFEIKIFGNLSPRTLTSNQNLPGSWSGWGFGTFAGTVQLEKSAKLLNTSTDMTGLGSLEQSALTQTKVTTFYIGASNTEVPVSKLTGTLTGIQMTSADYETYFPLGIAAGSQVKYYPKTTSIPSGSLVTYKNKLNFPIKLFNRQNIMSGITMNDKYAKVTVGDDEYITVKYDTLTQPELFTDGKIVWDFNAQPVYKLDASFFSDLTQTPLIIDYAEMYYESPNYCEFASTQGVSMNSSPYTWKGPIDWFWQLRGMITAGPQTGQASNLYIRWDGTRLTMGNSTSGLPTAITSQTTPSDESLTPRIIITLRFRPTGN